MRRGTGLWCGHGIHEEANLIAAIENAKPWEKLDMICPASLGQASRISGIHPADLAVLLLYLN